tara:strand:+ start:275 stop:634 length:360 start_codon:yes stop_codon:yes gene_type:complete
MAITSDGTQAFGIESSPLTIGGVTFVAESLSFNFTGTRSDINDSNGEPLGSTVIPGRVEVSGTVQLAADTTGSNIRQQEFVISATNSDIDGTYLITECSEAQTQGDYEKVTFSGYKKVN